MSSSTWRLQEDYIIENLPHFYRTHLGHVPSKVCCQIMGNQIVMTIEGVATQPEKLLLVTDQTDMVEQFRLELDRVLRIRLKSWITHTLDVEVLDLFLNTDLDQNRMTILVSLAQ